jgi:hypothetical protein
LDRRHDIGDTTEAEEEAVTMQPGEWLRRAALSSIRPWTTLKRT